jgi:hypothetical protein
MILIKFMVLCFIVFLCASPSCELVVFDPGKWLYRTRSEGLTVYSCLSVLLPLRVRLGHLSWNNSGGSATWLTIKSLTMCWTLNHQNIIDMAQGHISLSLCFHVKLCMMKPWCDCICWPYPVLFQCIRCCTGNMLKHNSLHMTILIFLSRILIDCLIIIF